ncbi:unnamed protein product [Meloidogyne enterolobii]|uniref:Uncharacterized protein n=1 Tax=Meloidogyne enterolobii TaxID=390850 RepID=A0ACB1AR85_MELEN
MWQYLRLQIHQATEFQTPFFLQSGNLAFIFYALIQATLFTQLYTAVLLSSLIRGENPRPWENYNEMVGFSGNFYYFNGVSGKFSETVSGKFSLIIIFFRKLLLFYLGFRKVQFCFSGILFY